LQLRRAVTQVAPVLLLGVGRMLVVKLLNYQVRQASANHAMV
jgi:hypothetical protein